jgi:hypothetical protein
MMLGILERKKSQSSKDTRKVIMRWPIIATLPKYPRVSSRMSYVLRRGSFVTTQVHYNIGSHFWPPKEAITLNFCGDPRSSKHIWSLKPTKNNLQSPLESHGQAHTRSNNVTGPRLEESSYWHHQH